MSCESTLPYLDWLRYTVFQSHEITGLDHSDGTSSLNRHFLIEKKGNFPIENGDFWEIQHK